MRINLKKVLTAILVAGSLHGVAFSQAICLPTQCDHKVPKKKLVFNIPYSCSKSVRCTFFLCLYSYMYYFAIFAIVCCII